MNRGKNLQKLREETFDICVIGAGATGAGVALDAALRGFRVALIEKEDFASETSSKSTKLIHGGVRYLEQAFKNLDFGQLKQVRHGLAERHFVLSNAPHLARPLGIITPVFSWFEGLYFSIGLVMYGWFAKNDTLPKARWLSKKETLDRIKNMSSRIHSGVLYYDGQLDDARYCLALVQSADKAGAAVANYTEVLGFEKEASGQLTAVKVRERNSGDVFSIKSRLFINCTGVFSDKIRLMANPQEVPRIRPSKGVHIILKKEYLNGSEAILIPKTKDGRVVFVIPFEGIVMVGTTDTPDNRTDAEPVLESAEVDYLLETISPFLNKVPAKSEVQAGFGGLRPLLAANRKDTKSLLRDHEIEHDHASNLLSVLGGKWTTFRLMAQDAVDEACRILETERTCKTPDHKLHGADKAGDGQSELEELTTKSGISEESVIHLKSKYGDQAGAVLALCEDNTGLAALIHKDYPYIKAEALYAARYEMAVTLRDFFARRIRFELTDWQATIDSVETVALIMAGELLWDESFTKNQIEDYRKQLGNFISEAS
ncbi:FAD-dependent oxidoreductase [Emticicia sp. CRIBPO]|uniref:glycerol-3-phosphate dehydrogenase/oxidase n=1 Tax=Emticicia sp. CRIBPO TaxID=2683258 RepID=UPI0014126881|nr:FAD-dependent oxidoreductase [Emticicia sp. CRIBPO]NBA88770.1 FAD-dependent oxidoreductase [Emticicia sp. CRIBPO]